MAANKRLQDLTDYKSVLPYASELFGVYQPLIGWKSARKIKRIKDAVHVENIALLARLGGNLASTAAIDFTNDHILRAPGLKPAGLAGPRLANHDSVVLRQIQSALKSEPKMPKSVGDWARLINAETLTNSLRTEVLDYYNKLSLEKVRQIADLPQEENESDQAFNLRKKLLVESSQGDIRTAVEDEAVIAGVLNLLLEKKRTNELASIFYTHPEANAKTAFDDVLRKTELDFEDPYLTFDPKKDLKEVSLSPIGIVHLFRQYFFELDTFLGTPVGHVWLSPGSQVELIEVSQRKTITEKTVEQELQTIVKTEKSTTDQDELSEAVKQENREDLKLGATVTVNQSWGTGNVTATASLNMDRTQQTARETTHKRMREQTEKLSSEIRENYKTSFKTITEVTDTTSKRYTLNNKTKKLLNYELRRKMRQVAVQVQDIGTYLCWETFVDEPGMDLGLANLVHIAQPPDLLPVPAQTEPDYPKDQQVPFQVEASWKGFDQNVPGPFIELKQWRPPDAPEGFELVKQDTEDTSIPLSQVSVTGHEVDEYTGTFGSWDFGAKFLPDGRLSIGIVTDHLQWDDYLHFVLGGTLTYRATSAKKQQITDAVAKATAAAGQAPTLENERKTKETFIKAAKERIEFASGITKRTSEDLREEERIVVYRHLISSLMTSYNYQFADPRSRHVLSELINSIFDVDKMLYFVAPDWWKPRERMKQYLSINDLQNRLAESIVAWGPLRTENYLITEKSLPAPLGSSLGWLLQLDGDNLRNAFLNAPWVKAVIPVRPGKEQAAMAWLQNVNVEGADNLDAEYVTPDKTELADIRKRLADHNIPVGAVVTLRNALDSLCIQVAEKYAESISTKLFPDNPQINDDNKVTSTPIEKVFEHGFYPLKGGFRVNPTGPGKDPNNPDANFQVFDQWIEVLPTDQVVPVEVAYNPKTGRMI
jgi:hypothetical protein